MTTSVVSLLRKRPEEELRDLREKIVAELDRLQVELALVDEALPKHRGGGAGRSQTRRARTTRGNTRKLVESLFRSQPETIMSPADVRAGLEDQGTPPSSSSAIYNAMARLKESGTITQVDDGLYQLASRNGAGSAAPSGPSESEGDAPLLTDAEPS